MYDRDTCHVPKDSYHPFPFTTNCPSHTTCHDTRLLVFDQTSPPNPFNIGVTGNHPLSFVKANRFDMFVSHPVVSAPNSID